MRTGDFFLRTASVLTSISILFPSRIKVVEHQFPDQTSYRAWLIDDGFRTKFDNVRANDHSESPFVWFSAAASEEPDETDLLQYLGGHDDTLHWCLMLVQPFGGGDGEVEDMVPQMIDDVHTPNDGTDNDLCVTEEGSGGMVSANEVARSEAKVVLLDFVKTSPQGTTSGLGGAGVNGTWC